MAQPSMLRAALQAASFGLLLAAAATPAQAGYKLLIKGPVCSGPNYCVTPELGGSGPVSISLPAYDDPNTTASPDMPALTFTGNITLQQTVSEMCKPGTNGQPEWLKAGSNVKGVLGSLTATDPATAANYTLVFSFNPTNNPNTACGTGTLGQETKLYARGYTITKSGRPATVVVSTGQHYVYNVAAIPEPETLLLFLTGLSAMGVLAWRKRR